MKLTITEAQNYDKKKDGTQLVDRRGRQQFRSRIKTVEKGNEWLTGFVYKALNAGDVIDAEVKSEMYQGNPQLRFEVKVAPSQQAEAAQSNTSVLSELRAHTVFLKQILDKMDGIYMSISTHQTIDAMRKKAPVAPSAPSVDDIEDRLESEPASQELSEEEVYGDPFAGM